MARLYPEAMTKPSLLAACAACFIASTLPLSALAVDQKMIQQLKRLKPVDQLEQRCDTEGMERLKADKVIAYTFGRPVYEPTHIEAKGAVFRRNGEWYKLAYRCTVSADRMTVLAFDFKPGERIAHKDWPRLYLYPP
ncbi:uncharacterized protein DUF930 [Neorhizobium alkalisoli]|uniref:Uncharacterized protein DUF930 n=2 Tax=Neorhizobium alkalisoli TaxID=528178 RepID=A0A561QNU3_9HYPH|nr:uncharacterized protein DUF930 [Neorhizobium alkalisoli]